MILKVYAEDMFADSIYISFNAKIDRIISLWN